MRFLFIAAGGAIGAVMRYVVSGWAYAVLGDGFPWGTLVVNLIGAFLIGFLWQLFEYFPISPAIRNLIFIGGLGAFTTFSTFAFETLNLFRAGDTRLGLLNVVVLDVFGILLGLLGVILGRMLASVLH
ncbi:MAG: fluoride efflux transporter CrcB [Candidatus Promineifilaceae bacterium]|nr:fluoride efflux transporter CrcB [Candidatus Promineifilaceae bacterium]